MNDFDKEVIIKLLEDVAYIKSTVDNLKENKVVCEKKSLLEKVKINRKLIFILLMSNFSLTAGLIGIIINIMPKV